MGYIPSLNYTTMSLNQVFAGIEKVFYTAITSIVMALVSVVNPDISGQIADSARIDMIETVKDYVQIGAGLIAILSGILSIILVIKKLTTKTK